MGVHIEDIEEEIVDKLKADILNIHVQSFPDNASKFQNIHVNGSLLVRYLGSSYSEPEANSRSVLVQGRTHEWEITIIDKSLKLKDAHQGVYNRIEQVRNALSGYTVPSLPDATILYPIRDGFVNSQAGMWQYEIIFSFIEPSSE